MQMSDLTDRIEQLKMEIQAMQNNPALKDKTYGKKVQELMRLRRQQTSKGNKSDG